MLMLREDTEIYNENDPSDPDCGPAESWGLWADRDTIELGPAFSREASFDVQADHVLALDELPVFEPSDEDLDALERLTYERRYGCNARFV